MTRSKARTAAIYVRISQDREGSEHGVTRQREDCLKLAEREGLTVARVYVDNDRSAYSGKARPEYLSLLDDIRSGAIDAVVVWHTDRLHRSMRELGEYIEASRVHDVATYSVKSGTLDLATATGRMQAGFAGLIAQHESEHRAERIARKHQQSAEAGTWRGGTRPFGFEADGMTLHPTEADEVRRLTTAALAGESLASLMRDLNDRGITTTMGNPWSYATIRQLLVRPRNAGLSVYQGEIVGKGQWPAIVDEDTLRAVTALLSDPARRKSKSNAVKHLLSGLARCGQCGAPMKSAVMHDRSGKHRTIYRCHAYPTASGLDAKVSLITLGLLGSPAVKAALRPAPAAGDTDRSQEIEALRGRLDGLAMAFADGDITLSQMTKATERIKAQLSELEAVTVADARTRALDGLVGATDVLDRWKSLSLPRRRAVIDALMTVTVHKGGKVDVQLRTDLEPSPEHRDGFTNPRRPVPTADQLADLSRLLTDVS